MADLRGILGLALLLLVAVAMSKHRRGIPWRTVGVALALQVGFAALVLRWGPGKDALTWVSDRVATLIGYADEGTVVRLRPAARGRREGRDDLRAAGPAGDHLPRRADRAPLLPARRPVGDLADRRRPRQAARHQQGRVDVRRDGDLPRAERGAADDLALPALAATRPALHGHDRRLRGGRGFHPRRLLAARGAPRVPPRRDRDERTRVPADGQDHVARQHARGRRARGRHPGGRRRRRRRPVGARRGVDQRHRRHRPGRPGGRADRGDRRRAADRVRRPDRAWPTASSALSAPGSAWTT